MDGVGASGWEPLLAILADGPRENGTAALHAAANQLVAWLEGAGLEPVLVPFVAHPLGLRLGGLFALAGGLLYWRLLRDGRAALGLLVALALPVAILLDLDHGWPIFSWLDSERQHHVSVTIPPTGPPEQQLLVTAHYDTKTDLLDHYQRAPVQAAAVPLSVAMVLAALAGLVGPRRSARMERLRRGALRVGPWLGVGLGAALFATLAGGAFVRARSAGALDDGGACAVAMRLAERVAAAPLARTGLEVVLLSAEEVGTQGARELAASRWPSPPTSKIAVVNLELIGMAPGMGALARESFTLRGHPAAPRLLALADAIHRERHGAPLHVAGAGATDAREFLARGVPAMTLGSDAPGHPPARGMHSAADDRSRLSIAALDEQLAFLEDLVREVDRSGL